MSALARTEKMLFTSGRSQQMGQKKQQETLPKMLPGTVHAQMVRCGRAGCRCTRGELHGPYYYRFWRQDGRLRKRYVRPADVIRARELCRAYQALRRRERQERQEAMQSWRGFRSKLREIDGLIDHLAKLREIKL